MSPSATAAEIDESTVNHLVAPPEQPYLGLARGKRIGPSEEVCSVQQSGLTRIQTSELPIFVPIDGSTSTLLKSR